MKKKKAQWSQILGSAVMILIGIVCGIILAKSPSVFPVDNTVNKILWLISLLVVMYLATIIHMIIHEAGHLIFGIMSGYRFSSFRILSHIWIKKDNKMQHLRLKIAGTGGQCLMSPPPMLDDKLPVILYNLGGSFANIIIGAICLCLYFVFINTPFLSAVLLIMALVGFIFGILNGIPMRLGTVDNDGYNAWSLTRNQAAMRAFWIQLKVNEEISQGKRLQDMPDEWFDFPSDENLKNSMVAVIGVFACNRLMDQHRFNEAKSQMKHMLKIETGIVGLHQRMMICDLLYLELIGKNRPEICARYFSREQDKFMRSMKNFPSIIRTQYAYALLANHDAKKAQLYRIHFNQAAKTYPYNNEVAAERELMDIAKNIASI